ncbi:uncharacterized protein METZ01_LOCUS467615, partial [marine metagenome]
MVVSIHQHHQSEEHSEQSREAAIYHRP